MAQHTIGLFMSRAVDRRLLADFLRESGYAVYAPDLAHGDATAVRGMSLLIADESAAIRLGRTILDLKWTAGVNFLSILILLPTRSDSRKWIRAGFDDVLREPITKEELRARIDVFLRLHDHAEQYRRMFENALIGIYRCGPDGRLLLANPTFVSQLRHSSLEHLISSGLEAARVGPTHSEFMQRLADEGVITGYETTWKRADGSSLFATENARAVFEDERLLYVEGSVEDISARKQAEQEREELLRRAQAAREQAEAASRLKDEFLATVSHELRTPLSAIVGWAQLLRSGKANPGSIAQGLEVIERQARTQAKLIDDLLDVSRIITGKLRLDINTVEPESFIDAGIEAVRPAAEAKGVLLQKLVDCSPDCAVAGDAARLQQVIWNLLSNAVKFTPSGGQVTVTLARIEANVQIAVTDTGEGITAEFLPFVFDRFRQHDGTTTRKHAGLGLGLAIVRHLVELHGGKVTAESEGPGRGAKFTVTLPLLAARQNVGDMQPGAEGGVQASEARAAGAADLTGVNVLLVDDEPDTLNVLGFALARSGADVTTASSAEDALRLLADKRPHVLVSDIAMPGVDGYELIQKVRASYNSSIRAAALTAYARPEDRARALDSGYEMHIPKPIEPLVLVDAVARLAGRAAADVKR